MEPLASFIASPLFTPFASIAAVVGTLWFTQRTQSEKIAESLIKDREQDKRLASVEKDVAVIKSEMDGHFARLMDKMTALDEKIDILNQRVNSK